MKGKGLVLCMIVALSLMVTIPVTAAELPPQLGLYWDAQCTQPVEEIDWGIVAIGHWNMEQFYIRNEGGCYTYAYIILEVGEPEDFWDVVYFSITVTHDNDSWPVENLEPMLAEGEVLPIRMWLFPYWGLSDFNFSNAITIGWKCAADINRDHMVNSEDAGFINRHFGDTYTAYMASDCDAINEPDGYVGSADLGRLDGVFGKTCRKHNYYMFGDPEGEHEYVYCWTPTLPEDLDEDGYVGSADIGIMNNDYGTKYKEGYKDYDLNRDGRIDMLDAAILSKDFGYTY